jgi:4-hydroxybenzoate polyprenyltransferase
VKLPFGKTLPGVDLRAWLQLVRLPNLLSVPGDPWVGLVLASAENGVSLDAFSFVWTALVSLCLYAAGLVLNDLHDEPFDQAHRPERPLPSQRVSRPAAAKLCTSLFALGLVFSLPLGRLAFLTTLVLVALVAAYNLQFKAHRTNAAVCMGLCRGCSVLVGAAAAGFGSAALVAAAGITVYIAAVTWIAAGENGTQTLDRIVVVPAYAFAAAGVLVAVRVSHTVFFVPWFLGALLLGWTVRQAWLHGSKLRNSPVPPAQMQPAIGSYIRTVIPWQAGLIAIGGMPLLGILLFAAAPFARQLARRYAES